MKTEINKQEENIVTSEIKVPDVSFVETKKETVTKENKKQAVKKNKIHQSKSKKTIMDVIDGVDEAEEDKDRTFFAKIFDKSTKPTLEVTPKVVKRFNVEPSVGLNEEQVNQRKEEGLTNHVSKKFSKSYKTIILENVFTFFNMLNFIIGGVLIYFGAYLDCMFLVITIANMVIGMIQEIRAKQTIDKLSLVSAPTAKVIRNGVVSEIATQELVLDDIMLLSNGKQICSDSIVVSGDVEVNESLLTGESIAVKKKIGDKLFSGSFIVSGNCVAKVEKVGKDNYVEILAHKAKKYKKPHSEIMSSLNLAIKTISGFVIVLGTLMFFNNYNTLGGSIAETVKTTSGSIIGMVPSGLFLLTSLALAVSVIRLAKNKTLVQDLYCIEMLARVNVLCLDKTGTITDGKMKVMETVELRTDPKIPLNQIMSSMLASLEDNNQTSIALIDYFGVTKKLKKQEVIPFSSERKYSAVTFSDGTTYAFGAPEFVVKNLSAKLESKINSYAQSGFRVLMVAESNLPIVDGKVPKNLTPSALIVIQDHIREDAADTIKWFKESGVEIKVISGDNPIAVSEIAKRVGVEGAENYISLEGLSGAEVAAIANDYTVFGRVTPEQKAVLVKSMRVAGKTVAMTGDGVNDILAMKESNCAIAMASGSEAARNVSHLVLLDSNFASMPKVVREGRRVINNIKNSASLFLMKTIYTIVLSIFVLLAHKTYPFTPKNMMLLEFFIIGISSFFLALEPNNNRVTGKFLPEVIKRSLPAALAMVINVIALFVVSRFYPLSVEEFTTMGILTVTFAGFISLTQVCVSYNAYKAVLVSLVLVGIIFVVGYLPWLVGIFDLSLTNRLITVIMIETTYPLTLILMWICKKFDSLIVPKQNNV